MEAARSKPCAQKGSVTLKANRQARVYEVKNQHGSHTLYGCLRSDRHRQVLASSFDDHYTSSGTYDQVTLKGHFVHWRFTSIDNSCKADCPPGYNPTTRTRYVRDLTTRKTRSERRIATPAPPLP